MRFRVQLDRLEAYFAVVLFVVMMIVVTLQVVTRLIGFPLSFTEELARFLYIWIVYLGMSYAIRQKLNIRLNIVIDKLSPKGQFALETINHILEFALMAALLIWSVRYMDFLGISKSPALGIPFVAVFIIMPITFALGAIRGIQTIIDSIRAWKTIQSGTNIDIPTRKEI